MRANERANERTDERVAQYSNLYSWPFSTIVHRWKNKIPKKKRLRLLCYTKNLFFFLIQHPIFFCDDIKTVRYGDSGADEETSMRIGCKAMTSSNIYQQQLINLSIIVNQWIIITWIKLYPMAKASKRREFMERKAKKIILVERESFLHWQIGCRGSFKSGIKWEGDSGGDGTMVQNRRMSEHLLISPTSTRVSERTNERSKAHKRASKQCKVSE